MRLRRMTTRGIMITIAVVGFSLGLMINVPWLFPLLLLMARCHRATNDHCGRMCLRRDSSNSQSINPPRTARC